MHSVILFVPNQDGAPNVARGAWSGFLKASYSIATNNEAVQTLGERCWLIPLDKSLQTFVALAHAAQAVQLKYQVLFFPDEPAWIESTITS